MKPHHDMPGTTHKICTNETEQIEISTIVDVTNLLETSLRARMCTKLHRPCLCTNAAKSIL